MRSPVRSDAACAADELPGSSPVRHDEVPFDMLKHSVSVSLHQVLFALYVRLCPPVRLPLLTRSYGTSQ